MTRFGLSQYLFDVKKYFKLFGYLCSDAEWQPLQKNNTYYPMCDFIDT